MSDIRFMQGNEAFAEGALAAGVRFFAGYPITPASEIAEVMSNRMPELNGVYMQMEDELASMAAIVGASMGGVKSMTATSGPGFSLMQENLGYAVMVEMPCVIVDVMRMGPASGMPTHPSQMDVMQARWGTHGDHPIVVLCPATVQEAYELSIKAVNISEYLRTPVIILSDAIVGHIKEKVELLDPKDVEIINRKMTMKPSSEYMPYQTGEDCIPEFAPRGRDGYRYHICSNIHGENGFPADSGHEAAEKLLKRLHRKIELHKDEITLYKTFETEDAEIIIVSYGCTARSGKDVVKELRKEGLRVGLLQLMTLWPFPSELIHKTCKSAKKVIVAEMNLGQLVNEVKLAVDCEVVGVNKANGTAISPNEIIDTIKGVK